MTDKKSWLDTHQHIRKYLNWGLSFFGGITIFLIVYWTLGPKVIIDGVHGAAHYFDIHLENHDPPPTPEQES